MWAVIVGLSAFVVLDFRAPDPAPADAPADAFSAERAWEDLVEITQAPHPAGSLEGARVRDHVAGTLDDLGWKVKIDQSARDDVPTVSNVAARLEGTCDTDDAVLLVTHHDSVSAGPGAGDVGSSVAALLEVARALPEGEPLCNDVIVLLTDGEESHLQGAMSFVESDPWADDVAFIVNFDARGGAGPLLLGEWSEASPELVREVAGVVDRMPGASSLVNEGPKRIDTHTTDFEILHDLDVPGVNGANVGDSVYYHTPLDTPDVVSRATVQHNGEVALALARHFGNEDLGALPEAERGVWIALTSGWLVAYGSLTAALLGLAVLILAAAVVWAARFHAVRWTRVGVAALAFPVAGIGAFVLTTFLLACVNVLHPGADIHLEAILPHNADLPDPEAYWWAFVAAGGALSAAVLTVWRRWTSAVELAVGGVLLIAALGVLTTFGALPISYLFVLPALGSLAGALIWLRLLGARLDGIGVVATLALSAVPALLVYVGFLRFSSSARLGLSALFVPVVAFLFVVLVPHLEVARTVRRWLAPSVLGGVALVLLVVAAVTTDAEPGATRPESVDDITPARVTGTVTVDGAKDAAAVGSAVWTVDAVETDDGAACLLATVPGDPLTGDVGWCPIPTEWAPVLDFQWGRTPSAGWSHAAGVRAAQYDPDYDEDDTERESSAVLFGGVTGDDDTTVVVVADGDAVHVATTSGAIPGVRTFAVELPAGSVAVDRIEALDSNGTVITTVAGFALVTDDEE